MFLITKFTGQFSYISRHKFPSTGTFTMISLTVLCPDLPVVSHASLHVIGRLSVGTVVTYMCDLGHYFPEGGRNRVVVCLPGGTWSQVIQHGCQGCILRSNIVLTY